jgi:hypothetical protein
MKKIIYHCLRRPKNDAYTSNENEASCKISHARDKLTCFTIIDRLGDKYSNEGERSKGVENDQNPLRKSKKKILKEVHRSNHILNVKNRR